MKPHKTSFIFLNSLKLILDASTISNGRQILIKYLRKKITKIENDQG